jgi:hypothetical protein
LSLGTVSFIISVFTSGATQTISVLWMYMDYELSIAANCGGMRIPSKALDVKTGDLHLYLAIDCLDDRPPCRPFLWVID